MDSGKKKFDPRSIDEKAILDIVARKGTIRPDSPATSVSPKPEDTAEEIAGNLLCRILRLRGYTRCRGVRSYRPFPGDNIQYGLLINAPRVKFLFSAVHNSFYYKVWEASRCVTAHNSSISSQRPEPFIWRLSGGNSVERKILFFRELSSLL